MDILHGSSPLPIHVNCSFVLDQVASLVRHRTEQLVRLGPCTSQQESGTTVAGVL
jgi:hypothetical protein